MSDAKFSCPACHRSFHWKREMAGKRAKCKCGGTVTVPAQPDSSPAEPVAEEEESFSALANALAAGPSDTAGRLAEQAAESRYHDASSLASDAGYIDLDRDRWVAFDPKAGQWWWRSLMLGFRTEAKIREHLKFGDSRAALVVSVEPLRVAAYTDEIDCVAMLGFPDALVAAHRLQPGSRLLTVNSYMPGQGVAVDLKPGPAHTGQYNNFHPIIADFVCGNPQRVEAVKAQISDHEWNRCWQLAGAFVQEFPKLKRNGSPRLSGKPAFRMVLA